MRDWRHTWAFTIAFLMVPCAAAGLTVALESGGSLGARGAGAGLAAAAVGGMYAALVVPFRRGRHVQRREMRDRARQLRAFDECPACSHPWSEHPGSGNDADGMCGECAYEFEHPERESPDPGCRLSCPEPDRPAVPPGSARDDPGGTE